MSNEEILEDDFFDFDQSQGEKPKGAGFLSNGERVKCIILDMGYTSAHVKEVQEANAKAKEEAESLGLEPTLRDLSFKEGGISAKVAIIQRLDLEGMDGLVFKHIDEANGDVTYEEPRFPCYTQITMLPPKVIYEKGWSSFTKGLGNINKNGSIYITNFIPSAFPAKNWDTGQLDEEKETQRQGDIQALLKRYDEYSEEQARQWLLKGLAQRFVFGSKKEDGSFTMLKPATGTVFEAVIAKKEDSRLFNLDRFKWNKDKGQWDIFGSPFAYRDDESMDMATGIIAAREVAKLKALHAKEAKAQQIAQETEVPF